MAILPDHMIRALVGNDQPRVFEPWNERTISQSGMSYGLSFAGYDVRAKQAVALEPGGFALLSTLERFSIPANVLAIVHDKSTWARRGITVQNTVAEPGWNGWLTLEIANHGREVVQIEASDPIAQIVLHQLAAPPERVYAGKYQNQADKPVAAIREPALLGLRTDPAILFALRHAAAHDMTPAERHAQRRSWVIGEMGLEHPELSREELEAMADRAVGPALALLTAEREA